MSDSEDVLQGIDDTDDVSVKFTFLSFCEYLEKHKNLNLEAFSGLLQQFKASGAPSVYPLVRLLLPAQDNRKFYVTSKGLKKVLNSVLHSPITSYNPNAEIFANALFQEFHVMDGTISLVKINRFLDVLEIRRSKRGQIFHRIGSSLGRLELLYFFNIILGDITEFVTGKKNGANTILQFISPFAKQLLSSGFSLKDICEGIDEDDGNAKNLANFLILGKPIRPMLLSRVCSTNEGVLKIIRNCGRPFYVETKFDGEHFIVHRIERESYMYYSRKGNDFSENFGFDCFSGFSAKIHELFKDAVSDCVLDCEFVIWDVKNNVIVGKNRRTSEGNVLDVKYLEDNPNFQRCLVVFDVLLLNGKGLMEVPLVERQEVLNKEVFKRTVQGVLMISKPTEISKVSDFFQFYKSHMENGEEGVVVKGKNTLYRFGQRAIANGWFKVKPDYGVRLTLDLALVGIKYDDVKHSKIKSFIIAASMGDGQLRIVGGVQCSLKRNDFDQLIQLLDLKKSSSATRPHWIQGFSQDKTILYVNSDNVQVVEVKASGLINGRLQFPAITALRTDKFVDEINFYSDVMSYEVDLRENKRHAVDETFTLTKNKKKRVVPGSEGIETTKVTSTYNQVKVYVVDDFRDSKRIRESKETLKGFGFNVIQNYTESVNFVVSLGTDSRKSQKLMQLEDLNIIKDQWATKCREAGRVVEWGSHDYFLKSENPRYQLDNIGEIDEETVIESARETINYDDIEDEYAHDQFSEAQDCVREITLDQLEDDNSKQMEDMTLEEYPQLDESHVFQELNFFMPFSDDKVRDLIENNGGNVLRHLNKGVTHIVFTKRYDFKDDRLKVMSFLESRMWQCVLTDVNWINEALRDNERYKDSLPMREVSL
ncbi:unnamed protein product [Bursaphelenchus xylophilus]|uniref:DNA ligase IV n=1 Tax=Bursaphelenchus xylophilus TaxID=6326 RepID=A0A1I7STS6_BURXY|nr:unnamed protein product [Bursaphelenchus xylophilus]CAG9108027.1 unnamed protein product [Bursaphelenchus xylophilus]